MNPVQMASIYSSFMNDGKMMTPHVVKSTETSVWAEPFSKKTTDEIKADLIQALIIMYVLMLYQKQHLMKQIYLTLKKQCIKPHQASRLFLLCRKMQ